MCGFCLAVEFARVGSVTKRATQLSSYQIHVVVFYKKPHFGSQASSFLSNCQFQASSFLSIGQKFLSSNFELLQENVSKMLEISYFLQN